MLFPAMSIFLVTRVAQRLINGMGLFILNAGGKPGVLLAATQESTLLRGKAAPSCRYTSPVCRAVFSERSFLALPSVLMAVPMLLFFFKETRMVERFSSLIF